MPRWASGLNWVAAGLAAAILLPVLAIVLGIPFWVACIVSALAGGGILFLLAPRERFEGLEGAGVARGKIEFARELLAEAEPSIEQLESAAKSIRTKPVAERVHRLGTMARDVVEAVEQDPLRIDRGRRFLTYYLPRAAEIAEAYDSLERSPVQDAPRLAATSQLIERLETAFARFATNVQSTDVDKLDIELKLLRSSLDDDLGPVHAPLSAAARPVPERRR